MDLRGFDFKIVQFTGKWDKLIGKPSYPFFLMIYGMEGTGINNCNRAGILSAATHNKKILIAKEEQIGYTIQEKFQRLKAFHSNISISEGRIPLEIEGYDVVFIDSVNEMGFEPDDMNFT